MTHETMTIHRALVELKTIDKRITSAIDNAEFVLAAKTNSKKVFGKPVEDFKANAISAYDTINDLISRRNAIKAAIPVSNAVTKITVGDKTMTVAEAIVLKQNGFQFYERLLKTLSDQYAEAVSTVEIENDTLDKRADAHVAAIYGGEKAAKAADPEDVKTARETYININTFEIYDGLKQNKTSTESRIKELDDRISKFKNDLDAALSVSNATTVIEIEY